VVFFKSQNCHFETLKNFSQKLISSQKIFSEDIFSAEGRTRARVHLGVAHAFHLNMLESPQGGEWWPRIEDACLHCDASNEPNPQDAPPNKLSDACQKKLAMLVRAMSEDDTTGSYLNAVKDINGICHSWIVHMMLQNSGKEVRAKFTDATITALFDYKSLELTMRWNKVAHRELLQDICDIAETMRRQLLVPFDVLMRNTYEVEGTQIFLWSEKYLRRCFDVSEMLWISCEDLFQRAHEIMCTVSHTDIIYKRQLQPNAGKFAFHTLVGYLPNTIDTILPMESIEDNYSKGWETDDEYATFDFRATIRT